MHSAGKQPPGGEAPLAMPGERGLQDKVSSLTGREAAA